MNLMMSLKGTWINELILNIKWYFTSSSYHSASFLSCLAVFQVEKGQIEPRNLNIGLLKQLVYFFMLFG